MSTDGYVDNDDCGCFKRAGYPKHYCAKHRPEQAGRLELRDAVWQCVEEIPNGLVWKLVLSKEELQKCIAFERGVK